MPAPTDFDTTFRELTPVLLSQGWLFPPKILGGELAALWEECERFRTTPPADEVARRSLEDAISQILAFNAFHPNYRAYYVWLAMQQPHASTVSHLIEAGAVHYFSRDYLSCVHVLLPAIEGLLRSHFHAHNPGNARRITHGNLRRFLRAERPARTYHTWHVMYREALADFLDRWLWENTEDADWDLSYLNRHYILHGMGSEHYYRSQDCHRLFMFLDLYEEMLVLETRIGENAFIPTDPGIERRRRYYELLQLWSERSRVFSPRLVLLREHPSFHDEEPRESFVEQLGRWARVMGLDGVRRRPR